MGVGKKSVPQMGTDETDPGQSSWSLFHHSCCLPHSPVESSRAARHTCVSLRAAATPTASCAWSSAHALLDWLGYMNSSESLPANKPPWSTLTAYDLNKGTIKWQIRWGSVSELAAKGIKDTGSYWPRGGVVVTAGGDLFLHYL